MKEGLKEIEGLIKPVPHQTSLNPQSTPQRHVGVLYISTGNFPSPHLFLGATFQQIV